MCLAIFFVCVFGQLVGEASNDQGFHTKFRETIVMHIGGLNVLVMELGLALALYIGFLNCFTLELQ